MHLGDQVEDLRLHVVHLDGLAEAHPVIRDRTALELGKCLLDLLAEVGLSAEAADP